MADEPQKGPQEPGDGPEDAVNNADEAAQRAARDIEGDPTPDPASAAALAAAMAAVNQVRQNAEGAAAPASDRTPPQTPPQTRTQPKADAADAAPFALKDFGASLTSGRKETLDLLADVQLNVRIELGRTRMYVEDVLQLGDGAVVELDKLAGDPVDVFVNDRHVARGEVLVLNDNFCVRINEILDPSAEAAG
jgi:flagellar motor switch protein FliN/FliY